MVTKKTQVISSNFFALVREISDLVSRISSALRSFPIFFSIDFLRLLDAERKGVEISYHCTKRFNKIPKWAVRFTFLLGYHDIHFSFLR